MAQENNHKTEASKSRDFDSAQKPQKLKISDGSQNSFRILKSEISDKKKDVEQEVKDPSVNYNSKEGATGAPGLPSEIPEKDRKEMEKTRERLEKFKKDVLKKFPFIFSIGIIPPQAAEKIEEEEEVPPEEAKKKPIHIIILMPEEKFKEIGKIKPAIIKMAEEIKPKIWLHIKTPVDVFNYCLDSKFDIFSAIAMSFPLHDKGFLGSLRVAEIHKSLVLRKFERYVTSYIIAGSFVTGEATKTSDVDVYVIIDDTDVKRMPRLELKEKLRNIIYQYEAEARELAGVKNPLHIQVYILTEFWDGVKDANPVFFTIIRDGVAIYDRSTFIPWRLLLKMGKLKPSPEAIDMFMSAGEKTAEIAKRRILDIAVSDLFWGIITPTQALFMLHGLQIPVPKHLAEEAKKIFVEKEKMLEQKYVDILDRIVKLYKDYEHEKIKEIKGEELDKLIKDYDDYMKRLKELEKQIQEKANENTIKQSHKDIFELLKAIFGKKSEKLLIADFDKELIRKGKLPGNYLHILNELVKAKETFKKGKLSKHEVENTRKNASLLINHLIEYNQRRELVNMNKGKLRVRAKNKTYELVLSDKACFLIDEGKIMRISGKLEKASQEDLEKALGEQKNNAEIRVSNKVFEVLKKELGEFEIIL